MPASPYPDRLDDDTLFTPTSPRGKHTRTYLKDDMPARIAKIDPVQFAELRERWGPFVNDPDGKLARGFGTYFGCCFYTRAVGIALWNTINEAQTKFLNAAVLVPVNVASPWMHNFVRDQRGRLIFFQGYFKIGKLPRQAALVLVGAGVEPGVEFADLATGYEVRFMETRKDARGRRVVENVPADKKWRRKNTRNVEG